MWQGAAAQILDPHAQAGSPSAHRPACAARRGASSAGPRRRWQSPAAPPAARGGETAPDPARHSAAPAAGGTGRETALTSRSAWRKPARQPRTRMRMQQRQPLPPSPADRPAPDRTSPSPPACAPASAGGTAAPRRPGPAAGPSPPCPRAAPAAPPGSAAPPARHRAPVPARLVCARTMPATEFTSAIAIAVIPSSTQRRTYSSGCEAPVRKVKFEVAESSTKAMAPMKTKQEQT